MERDINNIKNEKIDIIANIIRIDLKVSQEGYPGKGINLNELKNIFKKTKVNIKQA